MLDDDTGLHQSAELQKLGTYRKLFRDAFPEETAQVDTSPQHDVNLLINNLTVTTDLTGQVVGSGGFHKGRVRSSSGLKLSD